MTQNNKKTKIVILNVYFYASLYNLIQNNSNLINFCHMLVSSLYHQLKNIDIHRMPKLFWYIIPE